MNELNVNSILSINLFVCLVSCISKYSFEIMNNILCPKTNKTGCKGWIAISSISKYSENLLNIVENFKSWRRRWINKGKWERCVWEKAGGGETLALQSHNYTDDLQRQLFCLVASVRRRSFHFTLRQFSPQNHLQVSPS